MSTTESIIETPESSPVDQLQKQRAIVLVLASVIGAIIGAFGGYLLLQNAERKGKSPKVSAGEGVRLAVLIIGLLRTIADL